MDPASIDCLSPLFPVLADTRTYGEAQEFISSMMHYICSIGYLCCCDIVSINKTVTSPLLHLSGKHSVLQGKGMSSCADLLVVSGPENSLGGVV